MFKKLFKGTNKVLRYIIDVLICVVIAIAIVGVIYYCTDGTLHINGQGFDMDINNIRNLPIFC